MKTININMLFCICSDPIFSRNKLTTPRFVLESLIPGAMIHYGVIDTWACYLNYIEEFKSEESLSRIFCPTNIMVTIETNVYNIFIKTKQ